LAVFLATYLEQRNIARDNPIYYVKVWEKYSLVSLLSVKKEILVKIWTLLRSTWGEEVQECQQMDLHLFE
jgi:hypothetical protein